MSDSAHNGHRLLVADDEKKFLQNCQELLALHGFSVTTCSESPQVLALLTDDPYDAVLLDIRMSGFEGTDLLPLIKRNFPDLPVILVSAYCQDTDNGYDHSLGAFDAVAKPLSHQRLRDTIARAIQQEEHIPLLLTSLSLRAGRDQVYHKLILAALQQTNGNQLKAAKLLAVSRYCLTRWMKKLGISLTRPAPAKKIRRAHTSLIQPIAGALSPNQPQAEPAAAHNGQQHKTEGLPWTSCTVTIRQHAPATSS
jgi:DNA-binding NtrC family response regulator